MPKIIRLPEVLTITGLSRSTIYRRIQDGSFPQRVRLSKNCIGFHYQEVVDWINQLEKH